MQPSRILGMSKSAIMDILVIRETELSVVCKLANEWDVCNHELCANEEQCVLPE